MRSIDVDNATEVALVAMRQQLRRLSMRQLMERLEQARRWWERHGGANRINVVPLIEEEMRVRV